MIAAAPWTELEKPFLGLRSFTSDESHLYFGREGQSDELLRKMDRRRLIAIVGVSGSGKSSLVRAGLLPSLYNGYFARAGPEWHVADFRPGGDPIGNLTAALNSTGLWDEQLQPDMLRSSSLAIVGAARKARASGRWEQGENLLILADQFEELFRFRVHRDSTMADRDEKASFVKLLLEAADQQEFPIYVALTMRSDFLGDCSQFRGLPEAINEGQYLIPQMTRDQRRSAVEGPVRVAGGSITPRLVQRILNETGEDPGQLPIMQHALMRTWDHWYESGRRDRPIDVEDYEAIGTLTEALSTHADEAYLEVCRTLPGRGGEVVKRIFQRLRDRDASDREIRRPSPLAELCSVTEASRDETVAALEIFRREGRSFLMPPPTVFLHEGTQVDITHECLLRQWKRLTDWVAEEHESRRIYLRLADRAVEHEHSDGVDFLRGTQLQIALDWWERRKPSQTWAERYHPAFDAAKTFLFASRQHREQEQLKAEKAHLLEEQRKAEELRRTQQAREDALRLAADTRQRELRKRWAYVVAGIGLVAALVSAVLVWRTEQQRRIAFVRLLSAEADDSTSATSNLGVWLGLQAVSLRNPPLPQAEQALHRALLTDARESLLLHPAEGAPVPSVALSSDGTRMLAGGQDEATLWEIPGGSRKAAFRHPGRVVAALGPDGERAYTLNVTSDGDLPSELRIWDLSTGQLRNSFPLDRLYTVFALSPDGSRVATAGSADGQVVLWDTAGGSRLRPFAGHQRPVRTLAFSRDGTQLASASGGGENIVQVWRLTTGTLEATLGPHDQDVLAVAFSPDGKSVVAGSLDWTARIWNLATRHVVQVLRGHADDVVSVAFSPDGTRLATGSWDHSVKVWDAHGFQELAHLRGHSGQLTQVVFNPDGTRLASASRDGTARVWDLLSKQELVSTPGFRTPARSVAFGRHNRFLITGDEQGLVTVWDLATGWERKTLYHPPSAIGVAISPEGDRVASVSSESIRLWDVNDGRQLHSINRPVMLDARGQAWKPAFGNIAFSASGDLVATGGKEGPQVYDTASGLQRAVQWADVSQIRCVAFSPRGRLLAAGGGLDNKIRVFDAGSGKLVWQSTSPESVYSIAFSDDGRYLATGHGDGTVVIWNWSGDQGVRRHALNAHSGWVMSVAFIGDGSRLATASVDRTVKLWDVSRGTEILSLNAHRDRVYEVAFSPDGSWMASAGGDGVVRLYPVAVPRLIELARSRLYRAPVAQECRKYDFSDCSELIEAANGIVRGHRAAEQGRIEEAENAFRQTPETDLEPAQEASRAALAGYIFEARKLARIGRLDRASELLEQARRFSPEATLNQADANRLAALQNIAEARSLAADGDLAGALAKFDRAKELHGSLDVVSIRRKVIERFSRGSN